MFRVLLEHYDNSGNQKEIDIVIKTEKLYELLGRFTVKYGAPDELVSTDNIVELEYFTVIGKGYVGVRVSYVRVGEDVPKKDVPIRQTAPTKYPMQQHQQKYSSYMKPEVIDTRLTSLVTMKAFKKSYY